MTFNPDSVYFWIAVGGVIFAVYRYFRDPQLQSEKKESLLAQRVKWTEDLMERRFKDINDNFKDLLLQSNNHIHTVDVKVEGLSDTIARMRTDIVRLATVIEERFPKKI